jgi:hypothetical protein
MTEEEVTEFLTHLARDRNVAPATQNQALSALLFLYQEVLKQESAGWRMWSARENRQSFQWYSRTRR